MGTIAETSWFLEDGRRNSEAQNRPSTSFVCENLRAGIQILAWPSMWIGPPPLRRGSKFPLPGPATRTELPRNTCSCKCRALVGRRPATVPLLCHSFSEIRSPSYPAVPQMLSLPESSFIHSCTLFVVSGGLSSNLSGSQTPFLLGGPEYQQHLLSPRES